MEIIGLSVHLEPVAVTAVVFVFCSQVELVFCIPQLRGAAVPIPGAATHPSGLRETGPVGMSPSAMGWGRGSPTTCRESTQMVGDTLALGCGQLVPCSPLFSPPSAGRHGSTTRAVRSSEPKPFIQAPLVPRASTPWSPTETPSKQRV